jgi:sigma-B regulation protein RsbU (phosphoserine phosphatase)
MGAVTEGASARLAAHYALVDVLARADSVEDAAPRLLAIIGEFFGWPVGALWLAAPTGDRLVPVEHWIRGGFEAGDFHVVSAGSTFEAGVGLPGRVWQSGEPAWIDDVADEANFPRAAAAERTGLHAGVALPVLGRHGAIGVMEFFTPEVREPDHALLDLMRTFGRQVGQFIERRGAEAQLRASQEVTSAIVASALDAVITMDAEGRIVDFNPAAERVFGHAHEDAVGRELAALIIPPDLRDAHRAAFRRFLETGVGRIVDRRLELSALRADGAEFPVELTVTAIGTRHAPMFAGFIRDITERVRAEEELERLLEREHAARRRAEIAERNASAIARTLSQSLLPPHLPMIGGLELGAAFQPAGQGEVGGDFYDVFESGAGGWACLIGDVCGKGTRAAAATALARYTIRAAAMRDTRPSAVLRVLNDAFIQHSDDSDFCTVAYASLEPRAGGVRVHLAVAGHPLPLVLRAGGEVEPAGQPGTLIGIVADPVLVDASVELETGDALVFFTDGVIEARIDGPMMGTEGLADLLASCAGYSAPEIAQAIHEAVIGGSLQTRDDVAILVLRATPLDE